MEQSVKKILLTGGLGYLGGRMAKYFSDNGYSVKISTRQPENNFLNNISTNILVMQLDYCLEEQQNKAMKGIDTLIYLAGPDAHTNSNDPESLIRQHFQEIRSLMEQVKMRQQFFED